MTTLQGRRIAFVATMVVLPIMYGCSTLQRIGDPNQPIPPEGAADPFVVITRESAFVFLPREPPAPQPPPHGLLVAVWPDGKMVRAVSEDGAGRAYVTAHLTTEQVAGIRRTLGRSGIFWPVIIPIVIDADTEELTLRWGKHDRTWRHMPETGNDDCCSNHRITAIRQALFAVPLTDAKPTDVEPQWTRRALPSE
jgi:hypothetical protein